MNCCAIARLLKVPAERDSSEEAGGVQPGTHLMKSRTRHKFSDGVFGPEISCRLS